MQIHQLSISTPAPIGACEVAAMWLDLQGCSLSFLSHISRGRTHFPKRSLETHGGCASKMKMPGVSNTCRKQWAQVRLARPAPPSQHPLFSEDTAGGTHYPHDKRLPRELYFMIPPSLCHPECSGLMVSLKTHVYSKTQNVTLFGNRVFAEVVS